MWFCDDTIVYSNMHLLNLPIDRKGNKSQIKEVKLLNLVYFNTIYTWSFKFKCEKSWDFSYFRLQFNFYFCKSVDKRRGWYTEKQIVSLKTGEYTSFADKLNVKLNRLRTLR